MHHRTTRHGRWAQSESDESKLRLSFGDFEKRLDFDFAPLSKHLAEAETHFYGGKQGGDYKWTVFAVRLLALRVDHFGRTRRFRHPRWTQGDFGLSNG